MSQKNCNRCKRLIPSYGSHNRRILKFNGYSIVTLYQLENRKFLSPVHIFTFVLDHVRVKGVVQSM